MTNTILDHWIAQPWVLNLLFLPPLLSLVALLAARRRRRALMQLGRLPALMGLVQQRPRGHRLRQMSLLLGLTLLIVGSAGPQWGREPVAATARGRDLVVVLDMSRSMLADDVIPCRLEKAQEALRQLVQNFQQRGGHRLALVAFAGRARILCPLTHDYDHFRERLDELDADHLPPDLRPSGTDAVSGTRIGAGILLAVEAHDERFRFGKVQDILLLSDGDDPGGDDEWQEGVEAAREAGIPVYTVGIGDPVEGRPIPGGDRSYLTYKGKTIISKLQEAPLQAIAERTGGTYTAARTGPIPLVELYRNHIERGPRRESMDEALPVYRQRYAWFFGAALVLLSLEMTLGSGLAMPRRSMVIHNASANRPPTKAER